MKINVKILEKNCCYIQRTYMDPIGIVVHSTGVDNPNLSAFIGDENNPAWNQFKPYGAFRCVNAFIGKDKDGKIACYKTLPWDVCPYGCGKGVNGSFNRTHIQFEICEHQGDEKYFTETKDAAVTLCAYLCRTFDINPDKIVSHAEAHKLGYASNHADPTHWWKDYGYDMNDFRNEVRKKLSGSSIQSHDVKGVSPWANDAAWALRNLGITDGTNPQKLITREEVWAMLYRAINYMEGHYG